MSKANLQDMSASELIDSFAALAVEQDNAERQGKHGDIASITRLFWQMDALKNELKNRDGDQRRELLVLFDHPNMHVRLKAAKASLAVAPEAARRMLESIASSRRQPQAGDAGMCLWNLDRGVFVPE
jgi:uncharacterized protein DUF2019